MKIGMLLLLFYSLNVLSFVIFVVRNFVMFCDVCCMVWYFFMLRCRKR